MLRPYRIALSLVLVSWRWAAADTTPQTSLTQDWSNPNLITVGDNWDLVPGIVGYRGDGLVNQGGVDPQTVLIDGSSIDVIPNQSSPSSLVAGGVAEFDSIPDPVVALQGSGTADAPYLLLTVNATGQSGITVSYNLRDIDDAADNAVTPVALQYRVGVSGDFTNVPAAFVADATTGPGLAMLVTPVSVVLPADVDNRPVVQLRIITTNASGVDEWVGVDDIQVAAGAACFSDLAAGLPDLRQAAAAWGDCDGDGDLDLLVGGTLSGAATSRVYRNDGGADPAFSDMAAGLPGLVQAELCWVDYDGDGDLDIFLAGDDGANYHTKIFRNGGGANPVFTDALVDLPDMAYCAAAWGDYDNDGDLDLFLAGSNVPNVSSISRLFRNNGEVVPTFTMLDPGLPPMNNGDAAWGDYDNDGDLDLLLTAGATPPGVPILVRNDGGAFVDAGVGNTETAGNALAFGDYDADGDLDIALGTSAGLQVQTNQGAGGGYGFALLGSYSPSVLGSTGWGDYDDDGRLDLLTAGHSAALAGPETRILRQVPASPFFAFAGTGLPGTGEALGPRNAVAIFGDLDDDDDLDVAVLGSSGDGSTGVGRLYRNSCGTNTRPQAPTGLYATSWGNRVTFHWLGATDAETPSGGLSYNLRVGTAPGLGDIVPPMSLPSGIRMIPALGNAMENLQWSIDLAAGSYWWSVQTVDGSYSGSPFAAEVWLCLGGYAEAASGVVGTAGGAVAWGDYDNDGLLDLVVSGTTDGASVVTRIYRNDPLVAPGFFDIGAGLPGTVYGSAIWGDYDNDGDLDLALTGTDGTAPMARIYRNSDGVFADIGAGLTGSYLGQTAWGDYDNDGDLDLVVTGQSSGTRATTLYRNSGGSNPTFTDAGAGLVGMPFGSVSFCDYDLDGDADILVSGGGSPGAMSQSILYRNSGGASPTFAGVPTGLPGVASGSMSWGDYDADGDPDLALNGVDATSVKRTRIFRNNGGANPTFTDIGAGLIGTSNGTVAWGDGDNDGDLDLLVTGSAATGETSRMYANSGGANPTFVDTDETLPGMFYGMAAFGDLDRDHDLDIAVSGLPGPPYGFAMAPSKCRPPNTRPTPPSNLSVSFAGSLAAFSWSPATDTATPAAALTYELRIGTTPGGVDVLAPAAALNTGVRRVAARGNTGELTSRTIHLTGSGPWYWSVQAVDAAYEGSFFAAEQVIAQTGVEGESAPGVTSLWSAGPNPFPRTTAIGFSLAAPGPVSLAVFDVTGRRVSTLLDRPLAAGSHARTWNAVDDSGRPLASGLYFARLTAGNASRTLRLSVIR